MNAEIEKLRAEAPALDREALRFALRRGVERDLDKLSDLLLAVIRQPAAYAPETSELMAQRIASTVYVLGDGFDELLEIACKSLGVK